MAQEAAIGMKKRKAKSEKAPAGFDPHGPYMVQVAEVYGVNADEGKVVRIPIFCDVPEARPGPNSKPPRKKPEATAP